MTHAPLPPLELCERVGVLTRDRMAGSTDAFFEDLDASRWWDSDSPQNSYDRLGRELSQAIRAALPQDWSWRGKRVLDFGCGAGRVLRHLLDEAQAAELWGCDIDLASIAWVRSALSPPIHALHCEEWPPLPLEPGSLDLIYAVSVYTHLTRSWSAWMLEHHRLLRPGGLLLASFSGKAVRRWHASLAWDARKEGMKVFDEDNTWDQGGPRVFHSEWWIRRHWGRAFEILNLVPDGLALPAGAGQGLVVMRRRERRLTVEELERDAAAPHDQPATAPLRYDRRVRRGSRSAR
jgi:SAM-dependent methyltransferase